MPKPPAPSTRWMRKSPTSSVPSGSARRLPLDAGMGCIAFAIAASPRPMVTRTREHHPRKSLVASFALTNAPTAPNAATNGTLAECGQYCGGTMGQRWQARTFSLGAARRPCSCPHAPARICSEGLEMQPPNIPAVLIAIALSAACIAGSWLVPAAIAQGPERISPAASPSKDELERSARIGAKASPAWSRARPCTSSRRARECRC